MTAHTKLLLIGWDGAGWEQIHPLVDAGGMPHLARLIERGVMGDLSSLTPSCPHLLWTSVATGRLADAHGILDNVEPDPLTAGVRPMTRASLRAPFVWDLLAREGLRCQVTGWPVTHPAEGPATCVSEGFVHGLPRSVHPAALEASLAELLFDPQLLTGADLRLFVPELARIDQGKDKRLARLAVILAQAVSAHAAATTLLETEPWDLAVAWYGTLGQVAALAAEPDPDGLFAEALAGAYRFLDLFLGRLVTLAGTEATVMLVSDRLATRANLHAARGLLCAAGPGIEPDALTFGSGLLDVAPAILGLFGYGAAPGMAGRPIPELPMTTPTRVLRPHEQSLASATQALAMDPELDRDLRELDAMGYTDTIASIRLPEAEAAAQRRDFHLCRVLMASDRAVVAIPILEQLAAALPDRLEFRIHLAHAYWGESRYADCRALCESSLATDPHSSLAPLARAHLAIAEGELAEAEKHLAITRGCYGIDASLEVSIGQAWLRVGRWADAASAFRSAIEVDDRVVAAHQGLAQAMVALQDPAAAADAALDAIRLRYDLPETHELLGGALRDLGRDAEAARAFGASRRLGHPAAA